MSKKKAAVIKKVVQVDLKNDRIHMTTFVDYRKDLKEGMRITLREDKNFWWEVVKIYEGSIIDSDKLHTDWEVDI